MAVSYRVATRYAKSILDLAEEKGAIDAVKADMATLSSLCDENRDFTLMLESPIVNHEKKRVILNQIFKGKVHEITATFLDLITRKNRENALEGIAKEVLVQYDIRKGIERATVTTASPLTDSLKKQFSDVVSKATGKDVVLTDKLNEELIGGYVLRVEDKQIDQSFKSQLRKIKNSFKKGS